MSISIRIDIAISLHTLGVTLFGIASCNLRHRLSRWAGGNATGGERLALICVWRYLHVV